MSGAASKESGRDLQAYSMELDIDEGLARQRKAARAKHFHTVRVPSLRLLGLVLLSFLVFLHNRYVLVSLTPAQFWMLTQFLIGYGIVSWLILLTVYERRPRSGLDFLVLDLPVWCSAIYLTGGDQSWLFPVLLNRVADQANTNFRRVFSLLHFAVLSYFLTLLVYDLFQASVSWPEALTKLAILYSCGIYVSFTALTAQKLRNRTTRVIGVARELICELAEEKAATQQAVEAKARFLTLISHELRTPLNSILGFSELLEDEVFGELNDKQKRYVHSIHQGGSRLLNLVEEVLLYADARTDELALSVSSVDCGQLWNEILEKHELQIVQSGVKTHSSGHDTVVADKTKLEKALSTLLELGLSLSSSQTNVGFHLSRSSTATKLAINFDSVDLGEEELQNLQSPFQRSSRREGLGLELPLARHIVRAHGGFIEVKTADGKALLFEVYLPNRGEEES